MLPAHGPLPIIYGTPTQGEGNTRAGSNFEQSASLVTITDHNKLDHNNGQGPEPRVPGEHMCCSFTVSEVDATSRQKPPHQLLSTLAPPRRRIGRGAEVPERNRRIARVAGRLANGIR